MLLVCWLVVRANGRWRRWRRRWRWWQRVRIGRLDVVSAPSGRRRSACGERGRVEGRLVVVWLLFSLQLERARSQRWKKAKWCLSWRTKAGLTTWCVPFCWRVSRRPCAAHCHGGGARDFHAHQAPENCVSRYHGAVRRRPGGSAPAVAQSRTLQVQQRGGSTASVPGLLTALQFEGGWSDELVATFSKLPLKSLELSCLQMNDEDVSTQSSATAAAVSPSRRRPKWLALSPR